MRDFREVEEEIRSIWDISKYQVNATETGVTVVYGDLANVTVTPTSEPPEDPDDVISYTDSNDIFATASTVQVDLMLGYASILDGFKVTGRVDVGSPDKEERVAATGAVCLAQLFMALASEFKVDKTRAIEAGFPADQMFLPLK